MRNEMYILEGLLNEKVRSDMQEHEKEIVAAFLKEQMKELKSFLARVEDEQYLKTRDLEDFFATQTKRERRILRTILH